MYLVVTHVNFIHFHKTLRKFDLEFCINFEITFSLILNAWKVSVCHLSVLFLDFTFLK